MQLLLRIYDTNLRIHVISFESINLLPASNHNNTRSYYN